MFPLIERIVSSWLPLSSPPPPLSLSFFFFFKGGGRARRERPRLNPRLMIPYSIITLTVIHRGCGI